MAQITLGGKPIHTNGELPKVGSVVSFTHLVRNDMTEVSIESYAGKNKIISIFPSIDTGVCAASVRHFNKDASELKNTVILNVSADLPFANGRFCGAEGIKNTETLSTFRSTFAKDWGVQITDSAFAGLMARAVVVLSTENKVLYTELVPEIAQEPNYDAALKALR